MTLDGNISNGLRIFCKSGDITRLSSKEFSLLLPWIMLFRIIIARKMVVVIALFNDIAFCCFINGNFLKDFGYLN